MQAVLNVEASFLSVTCGKWSPPRRPLDVSALEALNRRYASARERGDSAELLKIGRELYAWLDQERWLAELRREPPPLMLEIRGPAQPSPAEWSVLHAPWELLADESGFLAADAELRCAPARRLGRPGQRPELDEYRLGIAFMAAAPRGQQELDFEGEEAAIMQAAGQQLDLFVEESGNSEELGRRLAFLKPPLPVLHISCHGHNAWKGMDGKAGAQPVLMLEDATGDEEPTTAGALFDVLGAYRPQLVFLSACLTATGGERGGLATVSDSLAGRLVRQIPAVLGWDGSVADVAATAFAGELYEQLGRLVSLPLAAAAARRVLLNATGDAMTMAGTKDMTSLQRRLFAEPAALRRDWHLARVWLGTEGGGPVVGGDFARSLVPPDAGHKVLLAARGDDRLEVANPAMFVGRRRELQRALRALTHRDKAGLLLHGMGRLGKSSLAARLIDRRPDLTPAVVYGAYDALSIVDALTRALEEHGLAAEMLADRRQRVADDPTALRPLLVQLLAGPCRSTNGGRPVLLLVDDLERILEPGADGKRHEVRGIAERMAIAALLHAFTPQRSQSRLVLTSRYPFSLHEGGVDLAARSLVELGWASSANARGRSYRSGRSRQPRQPRTAMR